MAKGKMGKENMTGMWQWEVEGKTEHQPWKHLQ